jgi:amidase
MKILWPEFLALWEGIPKSIEELIEWNENHSDIEFTARRRYWNPQPPQYSTNTIFKGNDNQKGLEAMRDCTMTAEEYARNATAIREAARAAVQRALKDHDVDVILGPCDSRINSVGAAAGYPVGNLPLGYANFNGRGFSLHAIAPAGDEAKIFQIMSAWEATFPDNVRPPKVLVEE